MVEAKLSAVSLMFFSLKRKRSAEKDARALVSGLSGTRPFPGVVEGSQSDFKFTASWEYRRYGLW